MFVDVKYRDPHVHSSQRKKTTCKPPVTCKQGYKSMISHLSESSTCPEPASVALFPASPSQGAWHTVGV